MADTKLSGLSALTSIADDDLLYLADTSATASKKITWANLLVTQAAATQTFTNKTLTAPDINGGTADLLTSLTVANNIDIGNFNITALSGTFDGLTSGRLIRAGTGGLLGDATVTESSGALGAITTLAMSNQLTNTLADGTAPFVITSTTVVDNLNVDQVDGYDLDQSVLVAGTPRFARLGIGAAAHATQLLILGATTGVSSILDEDNMVSDSATALATQQSIKKYVDDSILTKDTFLELTDTPAAYTTNGAIYVADNSNSQVDESAVILTEDTNTFAITKGTASLDIAAGATLNIDKGLQVTTNAGTLTFSASSKTLTVEDTAVVSQDYSSDASPTFAGLALGAGNLTMTGSLGTTGAGKLTKVWTTNLEITNDPTINGTAMASIYAGIAQTFYIGTTQVAINRSSAALTLAGITLTTPDIGTPSAGVLTNCSGTASSLTAGSVTNATLTTALTVNTGTVTLVGNVANDSVLTIGSGAVSVSGANTGDQDLSGKADVDQTMYIGTTAVDIDRTSATLNLAGIGTLGCGAITSSGQRATPNQSSMSAYLNSDQTLPDSSFVVIKFNTENYDEQNEFDNTVTTGTADATESNKLHDADGGFDSDMVGATVWNTTDNTYTTVSAFVDSGELTLTDDIMADTEGYEIFHSRFTATNDGKYLIVVNLMLNDADTGTRFICQIYKNSTRIAQSQNFGYGSTNDPTTTVSKIIELSASDTITVQGFQDSGGTKDIDGNISNTYLTIHRLD